ncbi:MAG TPA: hypothetical protein PL037_06345, partial [Elusimicrobiales bacterium]|nr:hypothetical protein [Elusimicrobiales bacterium]
GVVVESMCVADGQGMRGLAYERQKEKWSGSLLVGRIVAPQEPTANFSGRFATYTGGGKVSYNLRRNLKLTFDSALSKDDAFSITIDTAANTLKARQNFVYGGTLEWKALKSVTFSSEYQMSSYRADLQASEPAVSGSGYRHEIKYRSGLLGLRGRLSRVDPDFWSLASPATIHDRLTYDAEAGIYPAEWVSVSAGYNRYTDNLDKVPGNTTTTQTQMSVSPTVRLFGSTMLTGSMLTNTALGKPAAVQDNQTRTMSFSVMQPVKAHTLNASMQTSDFKDNTGLSHNLNSSLMSFSGAFRLSPRLSFSSGLVNSDTKDKADSSSSQSNSITGNVTYAMPRRSLAVQLWSTVSTNKNDSVSYPSDTRSMNVNFETIWLKSQSSKLTFGVGRNTVTDNLNEDNSTSEYTFLTRYNYSF